MPNSRAEHAKHNFVSGAINRAIIVVLPFITRIVVINNLGAEYLGLDSLFISVLQVLSLTELGFSQAVMVSMYKLIAENDRDALCGVYAYYRKIYRIVGTIILVLGIAIMPIFRFLIKDGHPEKINVYVVYAIFLINTAISYYLFAYKQTLLVAHQRQDIVSNINSIARITSCLIQILMLIVTQNYYYYLVGMIVLTIVTSIGNSYYADRLYPDITCRGDIAEDVRIDIHTKVKGLLISKLCITSRNSFDSIFISAFVGLSMTAVYNNYYYVLFALTSIAGVIHAAIRAGIGDSVAVEPREKNYLDMKRFIFLYMWIFGFATVCALCLYQRFIEFSFGSNLLFPSGVMVLFCIYFYVLMMGDIRSLYVEATGIWWEGRYRAVAEAVANLILNFVLGKLFGIYGIIIATLISLFVINFLWGSNIVFKHYFTQTTSAEYFKLHGFYALVTFVACVVTYFVTARVTTMLALDGIPAMVVILVICIILPNLIYMTVYRRTRIYKESIGWLGRVTGWEKYSVWKVFGKLS